MMCVIAYGWIQSVYNSFSTHRPHCSNEEPTFLALPWAQIQVMAISILAVSIWMAEHFFPSLCTLKWTPNKTKQTAKPKISRWLSVFVLLEVKKNNRQLFSSPYFQFEPIRQLICSTHKSFLERIFCNFQFIFSGPLQICDILLRLQESKLFVNSLILSCEVPDLY